MQDHNQNEQDYEAHARRIARIVFWICVSGVVIFITRLGLLFSLKIVRDPVWFFSIVESHFVATVGLPLAMLASLVIVWLFNSQYGRIKFKFLGLEFEGGSGPIILWVIVFLALVAAIKITW
jgi:hypothetical protein